MYSCVAFDINNMTKLLALVVEDVIAPVRQTRVIHLMIGQAASALDLQRLIPSMRQRACGSFEIRVKTRCDSAALINQCKLQGRLHGFPKCG
jgi:hypothetical protein